MVAAETVVDAPITQDEAPSGKKSKTLNAEVRRGNAEDADVDTGSSVRPQRSSAFNVF